MKYKILAIILAVTIAVSGFTFKSSASIPEFAVKVIEAILVGTAGAVAGAAAYSMGEVLSEHLAPGGELDVNNAVATLKTLADVDIAQYVTNIVDTDGITVYVDTNGNYYASASSSLTGDELELATKICNNLNSIPNFSELCEQTNGGIIGGSTIAGGGGASVLAYEKIKSAVGNAVSDLVQQKAFVIAKENGLTLLNNGALPLYNFDFVGPMQPGLELPTLATNSSSFIKDDVIFLQPYTHEQESELLEKFGYDPSNGKFKAYSALAGWYCLYNGDVYYAPFYYKAVDGYYENFSTPWNYYTGNFKRSDGMSILDVTGERYVLNFPVGIMRSNNIDLYNKNPVFDEPVKIDDNSFIASIPVGSIQIPRTDGEQAVTDGINLNLISSNPDLVLDENGNIVRIDGIDTAKLMELLQTIANNGSISFDSIEQYLQAITAMLSASNADAKTLNTVITNLNELTKAQNASIEDINANVAAIAKALEISQEAELDKVDFSGLAIEHTGLIEATQIVEGMPIVQQSKLLFNNLIQGISDNSSVSKAPNFVFYWDSNKDGKTERYNVLDLSFMENRLTNENLEDKGRFNDGLTIRQFVQYLILLLCYVSFAIKILKKLPSLIGGSGDAQDNLETIDKYK